MAVPRTDAGTSLQPGAKGRSRRARPRPRTGLLAVATALVSAAAIGSGTASAEAGPGETRRPNVIVVMTDDQRADSLGGMRIVRRQLAARGATFENAFATFPVCCPSRATFLTGQYAHNHGVLGNLPPNGGHQAFDDRLTLPVALRRSGYRTGFVGRYLNGYGNEDRREVPPGWNRWVAPVRGPFNYYNYSLNEDGRIRAYGKRAREYQTDLLADKALEFVRDGLRRRKPFFLTLSLLAPHERPHKAAPPNPLPAPRHKQLLTEPRLPGSPSFNELDVSDKPAFVQRQPLLDAAALEEMATRHRDRLVSLLAVDEAVGRLLAELRRGRELADTLIVFTSDNGFLLGEHRRFGKQALYEESVRVPLVVRGPGIPRGVTRRQVVGNVDLAPTILDWADAAPLRVMDGRSLRRIARRPGVAARRNILLANQSAAGVRTPRFSYFEHESGEVELYDLERDPAQLDSVHEELGYVMVRAALADRLARLRDCAGEGCR